MQVIYDSTACTVTALEDGLYMVGGKLFHIEPGTLDLSTPEAVSKLVDYALYIKTAGTPLHAFFGDRDTICHMQAGGDGGVCAEAWVLSDLPEKSRELAEKAMAEQEQADQALVEKSLAVPDDD